MSELGERLAALETEVKGMRDDLIVIERRINGPPRSESLSGRVHALESSDAAAKAATAALDAVKVMRRDGWSAFQKALVTGAALVAAAASVYANFGG